MASDPFGIHIRKTREGEVKFAIGLAVSVGGLESTPEGFQVFSSSQKFFMVESSPSDHVRDLQGDGSRVEG